MQKLSEIVGAIADKNDGALVGRALRGVYDRLSSQIFNSGALAVGATTTKVNLAAAINAICGGNPVSKAITNDFWDTTSFTGAVIATGKTNVICLFIDAAGAASAGIGTEATTVTAGFLAPGIKFPPIPEKKAMVGYAIISAVATTWTAGTSNFATSGGNYTVAFVNTVGMFDPTATI